MTLIDKLEFILKCIWDDGEFIRGVQGCLKDDKDRQEMINAIKQGCAKNPAEIAMYSWAIYKDAPFEDEQ